MRDMVGFLIHHLHPQEHTGQLRPAWILQPTLFPLLGRINNQHTKREIQPYQIFASHAWAPTLRTALWWLPLYDQNSSNQGLAAAEARTLKFKWTHFSRGIQ